MGLLYSLVSDRRPRLFSVFCSRRRHSSVLGSYGSSIEIHLNRTWREL